MQENNSYSPEEKKKNPNSKKTVIIAVICAAVLIIAAVIAVIALKPEKDKGEAVTKDGGTTAAQTQTDEPEKPERAEIQVYNAFRKTFFDSSSLSIDSKSFDAESEESSFKLDLELGKDFDSSTVSFEDNERKYYIRDGKITITVKESGASFDSELSELYAELNENFKDSFGEDFDLRTVLNRLVSDGRLNEAAFKELFNSSLIESTQDNLKEEGVNITLPDYDRMLNLIGRFLENGVSEKAFAVTADDTAEGKSFDITINAYDLLKDFAEFLKTDSEAKKYIDEINASQQIDVLDEFGEQIESLSEMGISIKGNVTLDADGRVSSFRFVGNSKEIQLFSTDVKIDAK